MFFFLEQSLDGAEKYFLRKIAFLKKQMETVQPGLIEKHNIRQGIELRINSQLILHFFLVLFTLS